jgi:putative oxygen-independent coproporphyrinogen III oxidase
VRPLALYVHFPWCVRKCPYCDFNSHPSKGTLAEAEYLAALEQDLAAQLEGLGRVRFDSVFFGGGTPSLFRPQVFSRLLEGLEPRLAADAEITLEANPGTTERHDLRGYVVAGVNRLSLGAQSFDDAQLKRLGRIHDATAIRQSFEEARRAGFVNINLDLMYGLPQQTVAGAMADLEVALNLEPEHLSWYQLTLEPRTEFARRPPSLPGDDVLATIEQRGLERLDARGFSRYEVSAFARPGRRCRHNLTYWTFGDYLGVGAGAHGKLSEHPPGGVVRTSKPRQPRLYLAEPTATRHEPVPPDALPGEFLLNALRLTQGVELAHFESVTGLPRAALEPTRARQVAAGLLEPDRLTTTARGYAVLDSVIADYL